MRRPFAILFLLLTLAACAAQRTPAAPPGPTPIPAPPAPANGLLVYARAVAPGRPYEPLLSDLVVVDELGREQRTLPITNVLQGFATRAPNKAIYRTTAGYFLADAALGTVQQLPITQPNPSIPLVPSQYGKRWMLLTESRGGMTLPAEVNYLVDLERGSAVELNALTKTQPLMDLYVLLAPNEEHVLAIVDSKTLILIPTVAPQQSRTIATADWIQGATFSSDSQWLTYTEGAGPAGKVIVSRLDGSQRMVLASGDHPGARFMHDPNLILVTEQQGMTMINLASGERRTFAAQCAGIILSDTDDSIICGNQFIDLTTGVATPLPELERHMLYTPEHQRWAVFGTVTGGDVITSVPTRIVDMHTGKIVVSTETLSSAAMQLMNVTPDGSALLVASDTFHPSTIWLVNSDGTSQIIHHGDLIIGAGFSPDGQFILLTNTVYDADATLMPTPISLLDRSGKLIRTLAIPGIYPIWLEQ